MKRKDLLERISKAAKAEEKTWRVHSEGANHTIYLLGGKKIPVGRHREIDDLLAEKIFKECEEVLGQGWWR